MKNNYGKRDSKRDDQENNLQYKKNVAQKPKETKDLVREKKVQKTNEHMNSTQLRKR
jgi:hypothetical protein